MNGLTRMDHADFAEARRFMVLGQLMPSGVNDPRVLSAMRELPRERFVPAAAAARAYADAAVPLPGGRSMATPLVTARLVQLAGARRDERALVLCAGTGFAAALLAALGAKVTAVEEDAALAAIARAALPAATDPGAVTFVEGPAAAGHAAGAPYDLILIEGAVPAVPRAVEEQLAEGGRLVTIIAAPGGPGRATLVRRTGDSFTAVPGFDAPGTPAPAFAAAPAFAF